MGKILISACLMGDLVRYDGRPAGLDHARLKVWREQGRIVAVCPEVAGGLSVPRSPAQITGGTGVDVLDRRAGVMDVDGRDVTAFFLKGAEQTLSLARRHAVRVAVLKEKSPSCGVHRIYDGHFNQTLRPGVGVTTALLEKNAIRVFSEHELDQAAEFLQETGSMP